TQVRACSPDTSRVAPPSVIVHHTAPRRNMITPSRIGATIPNAGASPDMWPMTQAARRLAIALADAWRSEPTSAASPSSSPMPPVDRVARRDQRLAFGGQPGQDQRDAGPQVVRDHLGAGKTSRPVHHARAPVELDRRTHLDQLADQRVPPVEDRLADVAGPLG